MPELVVLALEQMMQRQRRRGAIRSGAIGGKSALDDRGRFRRCAFNSALKAGASLRLG